MRRGCKPGWKDGPTDAAAARDGARVVVAVSEDLATYLTTGIGLPRERIRLHCCWGNWEGPHVDDIPMGEILPVLYQARVGALSIEFANPRHQHEYAALKKAKLPDTFLLLPGVIDSKFPSTVRWYAGMVLSDVQRTSAPSLGGGRIVMVSSIAGRAAIMPLKQDEARFVQLYERQRELAEQVVSASEGAAKLAP